MSYINDALRKAQQAKDSRYGRYSGIISRLPAPRSHAEIKWIVAAVSMMLMLAALIVWLVVAGRQEQPVTARQQTPEKAIAAGQAQLPTTPAPAAGTAPPAIVAQTTAVESAAPAKGTAQTESEATAARSTRAETEPPATIKPPLPEVGMLYREALAAQRNKKAAVAERLYRRILILDAKHIEAMNNLGVLYMAQGKQDQAIALFRKAIILKKNYVDSYYNLSCLYAQRNDAAKSIAYLKSAIAIDRAVVDWAKADMDMKNIRDLDAFRKLMEKEGK
jgi:tetratricopeptide (TPR) repeat protein